MIRSALPCPNPRLADLLDDLLPQGDAESIASHIEDCGTCRKALEQLAATPRMWEEVGQKLSAPSAPPAEAVPGEFAVSPPRDDPRMRQLLPFLGAPQDPRHLGRLGAYEITAVLGWGGMGVVLRGFDESLGRPVAIKVLHPHLAANGAARRRFAREARAAAAVTHPSVVPIHAVNADAQPPYLVMAYITGGSLQDRISREGPLETAEVLRIGYQIADALSAAHAQGLVHRDVKPANILLDHGQNRVMLTDFGLAQALDDATLTSSGLVAGTPQYMSPEQARGETVDARSDLYSLGGVLYAMATGRPPFRAASTLAVLQKIGTVVPRRIDEINPDVPRWLADLVATLQSNVPNHRPATANDVAGMLRECLAHVRRPSDHPLPQGLPITKPPAPLRSGQYVSRRLLPWIAGLVVLLVLVKVAVVLFYAARTPGTVAIYQSDPTPALAIPHDPPPDRSDMSRASSLPVDLTRWDDGLDAPFADLDHSIELASRP